MSELGRIRQGVIEAGKTLRDAWPGLGDGPSVAGAQVVLAGVDPTHQAPHQAGRAIIHRADTVRVAIPMDMAWAQRVGELREIQTLLGFRREERWDVQATVLEVQAPEKRGGEGETADEPELPEIIVKLGAIYVVGQLLIQDDGEVPGLQDAIKRLDRLQSGIVVSNTTSKPDALLPLLFKILETHHWRAFRELYDANASLADKKVAFEQQRHAWDVSSGKVAFDGYVEPQLMVDEAVDGSLVRTRVKRTDERGEEIVRPLKWIKRGAGWRLAGGLL
jgi:hypothetical protein